MGIGTPNGVGRARILFTKGGEEMKKKYMKPELIVINLNEDVELFRGRCAFYPGDSGSCYA